MTTRKLDDAVNDVTSRRNHILTDCRDRVQTWIETQGLHLTAAGSTGVETVPLAFTCRGSGERIVIGIVDPIRFVQGDVLSFVASAVENATCVLVVESPRRARRVDRVCREPYARRTADGLLLYSQSRRIELETGDVPVWRADDPSLTWECTHTGLLRLLAGSSCLATGSPSDVNEIVASCTPRIRTTEIPDRPDLHSVYSASGKYLDTIRDGVGSKHEWLQILKPHVPRSTSYPVHLLVPDVAGLSAFG